MASVARQPQPSVQPFAGNGVLPPLEPGDHLDQKAFHARYEAMPSGVRAELIEGVVYMPSWLKLRHSRHHARLMGWLFEYNEATPGTDFFDNATSILGPKSEPQPDACLIVVPEKGGQTKQKDDYMIGAPELIAEVASSTEAYDLHSKKRDCEKAGVNEYLVLALRQDHIFWFALRQDRYEDLMPGPDGIIRSQVFPGLWLDPAALLDLNMHRLLEVLRQGLASPEHTAWVAELAGR